LLPCCHPIRCFAKLWRISREVSGEPARLQSADCKLRLSAIRKGDLFYCGYNDNPFCTFHLTVSLLFMYTPAQAG
jgi:hypothetical protein